MITWSWAFLDFHYVLIKWSSRHVGKSDRVSSPQRSICLAAVDQSIREDIVP